MKPTVRMIAAMPVFTHMLSGRALHNLVYLTKQSSWKPRGRNRRCFEIGQGIRLCCTRNQSERLCGFIFIGANTVSFSSRLHNVINDRTNLLKIYIF